MNGASGFCAISANRAFSMRGEQAVHGLLTIDLDGALLARLHHVVDLDRRVRQLLVGVDGVDRAGMVGNVVHRTRARRRRRRDRREVRLDQVLDRGAVEVADRDDGHQIGAVPVLVEARQLIRLERLDDFRLADRQPVRVARALEQDRKQLVGQARARAAPQAPLFHDDAALLVDLDRIERHVVRPVFEHQQRAVDRLGLVGRNLQHVHGLVEARVGVEVRAEAHPERLDERDDGLLREVLRAVERHVLDEVREPLLVVVLEDRSGLARRAGAPRACRAWGWRGRSSAGRWAAWPWRLPDRRAWAARRRWPARRRRRRAGGLPRDRRRWLNTASSSTCTRVRAVMGISFGRRVRQILLRDAPEAARNRLTRFGV